MFSSALKRALGEVKGGWKRSVHAASFSANSCTGLFIPSVLIILLLLQDDYDRPRKQAWSVAILNLADEKFLRC